MVFVPKGKVSTPVVWSLLSEVYPLGKAIRVTALCIRFVYKMVQRIRARNEDRCQVVSKLLKVSHPNLESTPLGQQASLHLLETCIQLVGDKLNFRVKFLDLGFMNFSQIGQGNRPLAQELANARLL